MAPVQHDPLHLWSENLTAPTGLLVRCGEAEGRKPKVLSAPARSAVPAWDSMPIILDDSRNNYHARPDPRQAGGEQGKTVEQESPTRKVCKGYSSILVFYVVIVFAQITTLSTPPTHLRGKESTMPPPSLQKTQNTISSSLRMMKSGRRAETARKAFILKNGCGERWSVLVRWRSRFERMIDAKQNTNRPQGMAKVEYIYSFPPICTDHTENSQGRGRCESGRDPFYLASKELGPGMISSCLVQWSIFLREAHLPLAFLRAWPSHEPGAWKCRAFRIRQEMTLQLSYRYAQRHVGFFPL
jgi:hypothetical protein